MDSDPVFIEVSKASRLWSFPDVRDLQIVAVSEFPQYSNLPEARVHHALDGQKIVDALCVTLPGGTIDAILIALLDKRRSALRVRY